MEAIKIITPNKEMMDNSLTEAQQDELLTSIKEALEKDNIRTSVMLEDKELAKIGDNTVPGIIKGLINYIKNSYSSLVRKIYDQAKDINDLYTKVEAIISTDKMARFKHRNDIIPSCDIKSVYMVEKNNSSKVYYLQADILAYDPEYFINQINDAMAYVDAQSKDKSKDLEKIKDDLNDRINKSFMANHGYVVTCNPILKTTTYKNQKLGRIFKSYERSFGNFYRTIYIYDKYTQITLQYMQYLQQAYNKMLTQYGKDKIGKKFVDDIFKNLLKNITASVDFNQNTMKLCAEVFKYYAEALQKIYDIYRS